MVILFKRLKEANRLQETIFVLALALFCFCVSMIRCVYTGTRGFVFLNWNLFLAFVPWALTSFYTMTKRLQKSKIAVAVIFLFWLMFFPNAPYILTDLFHLRRIPTMPVWFDLLMILSFAWTGLLFGYLSLWDIERILKRKLNKVFVRLITTLLLFLGSFGVYLGRYLRWNSWDVITKPFMLMYDIGDRVFNPLDHQTTWGMTLFMGLFLNIIYWSFYFIRGKNTQPEKTM
jgi:uncharacterized membrane protein